MEKRPVWSIGLSIGRVIGHTDGLCDWTPGNRINTPGALDPIANILAGMSAVDVIRFMNGGAWYLKLSFCLLSLLYFLDRER